MENVNHDKRGFILLFCVVASCFYIIALTWSENHDTTLLMKMEETNKKHFVLQFLSQIDCFVASLFAGMMSLLGSWTLTYFNWYFVGAFPATPCSPIARNKKIDRIPIPAIISSLGLAPLLTSIATAFFVWYLLSTA